MLNKLSLPQCRVEEDEGEECIFSVVLQVLTASGREVGVVGRAKVRGFNPHVFD